MSDDLSARLFSTHRIKGNGHRSFHSRRDIPKRHYGSIVSPRMILKGLH